MASKDKIDEKIRVQIFATHPIQYYVPWFRSLGRTPGFSVSVNYCMIPNAMQQGVGFGVNMQWDLPLLDGYNYTLLGNVSKSPSLDTFRGCIGVGILDEIKRYKPHVAIITGWNSFYLVQALIYSKIMGVKVLVRGESNVKKARGGLKLLLIKTLVTLADGLLYIGTSNKKLYEICGAPSKKLFYAPYFVDNSYLITTTGKSSNKIVPKSFVALFVGKFVKKKRPMDFVLAINILKGMGYAVEGVMVGTGELYTDIAEMIRKESVPVTLAGFVNQSNLHKYYESSSCFVLPSDEGETWGLVVNEAMLFGLPVVVSDKVGCSEDLVSSGVTGYSYNCGNVDDLVEKLELLINDRNHCKSMGEKARKKIVEEFNVENTTKATTTAIYSLI